ncbi:hypothetical protein MIND_01025700 [Mycena indigotica]|uniref:Vacuolar sorting protein 39/Transforming growth factor beta receptor-associated domain-containing protein n=1 Tax=Mycena indigotica TaxID=2126181 RepID=A0A8H6S9N6_9AGAR|nr:uncharacterized protein MIND_01025700 [Mycena indigotica]KAF7294878.1 hypothetical protein MIND_01025700 [Mycena indigotica]
MAFRSSTFPKSGILLLGSNVQSLVPSTLISQAESLLEGHRIEEAVDLADQQRKKLQANVVVDEDEVTFSIPHWTHLCMPQQADELRYVYQRIGFQCFTETMFEDAGKNLFNGELDPRVLVSYYPELRGTLFTANDSLDIYAGVSERMPAEASVDDIIAANLVRNYSPYLKPNTQTAPPTAELRRILGMAAVDMLEVFLKRCRKRRAVEGKLGNDPAQAVVDTVLAKIYAQSEKTKELYTLIQEPHSIVLSEVESVFKANGQYNALCMLYQQLGDEERLLQVWSKLAEGEWSDEDVQNPTENIFNLLSNSKNRALIQTWALWLTRRDPERGIKLLISRESGKRPQRPEDDLLLLEQIREASPAASAQFLEYLVLQKRSISRDLHTQLAAVCTDQLLASLEDKNVARLWEVKATRYAEKRNAASFLSVFMSTTPDSPSKFTRLKCLLFFQSSALYDAELVRERLLPHAKRILALELAIVNGKLGNHHDALASLVNDLHDSASAETYCTLNGEVIPVKVAQSLANDPTLRIWTAALTSKSRQKIIVEDKRKELLKTLLQVYMDDESASERAAHLLNSQAKNLDVLDVMPLVPPKWPLTAVSSFLTRSLRRTVHARQEGRIVRALSAGQNLEVKERTWLILREEGMVVEEALDGDDGDGEYNEKAGIEKVVSPVQDEKNPGAWADDAAVEVT